jgi:hypothetical protein
LLGQEQEQGLLVRQPLLEQVLLLIVRQSMQRPWGRICSFELLLHLAKITQENSFRFSADV